MSSAPFIESFALKSSASTPDRNSGSVIEVEPELGTLYKRYEQFQQFDLEKTKFMNVGAQLDLNSPHSKANGETSRSY
jgi:hypothetical protein